jgi:DNA-binding transcriptional MocR family regulator
LAEHLGVSVGTVTKGFLEAEHLGLVSGQVGRGTFVTGKVVQEAGQAPRNIDLSINVTPLERAGPHLAASFRLLAKGAMSEDLLAYAPPAGMDTHRKAAARWLARTAAFPDADWSRLVITCGGQQAMTLACAVCCEAGSVMLCEAATYYGMKALAEEIGVRLHAVALDDEGVLPEALDRAAATTGARLAYLMPTVQVPTGRTMSASRRADVVRVARARKMYIIEDDHYALFRPDRKQGVSPLAQIAPDICFYVSGVSKTLSPGLRTGFLVAPTQDIFERTLKVLRSTVYANAGFGPTIMTQWIGDGSADKIAADMVEEVTVRWRLASAALRLSGKPDFPFAPHVWLPLNELDAERAAGRAQRAGVTVTPPELPLLDAKLISGLRICIGAPKTREDLTIGLERLSGALTKTPEFTQNARI